jgi:hypothetical protein
MVVEGFLAVTGQTLIRDYMLEHSMYPGFCEGFGLVERDEHRHVAFGVRYLRDAIREDPRHRETVERVVLDLAPKAAYVFAPPYVTDPDRVRLVRLHVAADLRLRLPDAAPAHEGPRHRDPAGGRVHAGTDRRDDRVHRRAGAGGAGGR